MCVCVCVCVCVLTSSNDKDFLSFIVFTVNTHRLITLHTQSYTHTCNEQYLDRYVYIYILVYRNCCSEGNLFLSTWYIPIYTNNLFFTH